MTMLQLQPLTQAAFAAFGEVIETAGADHFAINKGYTQRYHRLADVQLGKADDTAILNIFRSQRWPDPIAITMLEQHPLGSQAFMPLTSQAFLVIVASKDAAGQPHELFGFVTNGHQGVNYHQGVWHHPLLILAAEQDFLIIDRAGEGNNLIEVDLPDALLSKIQLKPLITTHLEN